MVYEIKENTGTLFKNEKKLQDNHSDYTGEIKVDGKVYFLNAWIKTSQGGKKFMSLSIKLKNIQPTKVSHNGVSSASGASDTSELDDEIPFC